MNEENLVYLIKRKGDQRFPVMPEQKKAQVAFM